LTSTPGRLEDLKKGMDDFIRRSNRTFYGSKKDKETLYSHTLQYVLIDKVMEWTRAEGGDGYGYFSLQGPEHINSVCKYALMKRTNLHFSDDLNAVDSFERILRINRIRLYYFVEINNTRGMQRDQARKREAL
jgi:hypothetical protein